MNVDTSCFNSQCVCDAVFPVTFDMPLPGHTAKPDALHDTAVLGFL